MAWQALSRTKKTQLNLENLANKLTTINQQDLSWRGHSISLGKQVKESINQLMYVFKKGYWSTQEKEKETLHHALLNLKASLIKEVPLLKTIDIKADRKMRSMLEHRLSIMQDILNRFSQQTQQVDPFSELLQNFRDIRNSNLFLLEKDNLLLMNSKEKPTKTTDIEHSQPGMMQTAEEQIKGQNHLITHVMQNLIGNGYEFVDLEGNKILQQSLNSEENDTLRAILHRNYRDRGKEEIKQSANQALELMIKGFCKDGLEVPTHIQQGIDELKELISSL